MIKCKESGTVAAAYSQVKIPLRFGQINYPTVVINNFPLIIRGFQYRQMLRKTIVGKHTALTRRSYCHFHGTRKKKEDGLLGETMS